MIPVEHDALEKAIRGDTDALAAAFVFSKSPQGHTYWAEFAYEGKPLTDEAIDILRSMRNNPEG